MEEHRLKPMVKGYDQDLFNKLYKDTEGLRKSLAYNIDARRFGVDYKEILSWFDVKFIYVFNKYYPEFKKKPGVLKGHLINSLKLFKYRILKEAYMQKNAQYKNKIEITELEYFENLISTEEEEVLNDQHEELLGKVMTFFKQHLSDDAFFVFELQLNPPPFILDKLQSLSKQRPGNLPNELLADYLGFIPTDKKVVSYITDLKREIKSTIESAREHFHPDVMQFS